MGALFKSSSIILTKKSDFLKPDFYSCSLIAFLMLLKKGDAGTESGMTLEGNVVTVFLPTVYFLLRRNRQVLTNDQ